MSSAQAVDFNRDVRPILSNKCYQCHGPDPKVRKGKFRLDNRDDALTAIVPGKPNESELLQAHHVRRMPSEAMPPAKSGKKSDHARPGSPAEVDRGGGEVPGALVVHQASPTDDPGCRSSAIADPQSHRCLHLLAAGTGEAHAPTRGRQVHAHPPRRARPDRPAADAGGGRRPSSRTIRRDAYEKLVDRLLAKPALRRALGADVARPGPLRRLAPATPTTRRAPSGRTATASSSAFNANMPFDRFTIEQLAGDLLAEPDRRSSWSPPPSTATR